MSNDDLRTLAEAATPGPWFDAGDQVYAGQGETYSDIADIHGDMDIGNQSANAAFIAAASPDRILALLDQLDRLQYLLDDEPWTVPGTEGE